MKNNGGLEMKAEIRTNYDFPPIPTRNHDWLAWHDGNEEHGPIGHGATEAEAITDLREKLDEL